jgi:hypothetical protein
MKILFLAIFLFLLLFLYLLERMEIARAIIAQIPFQ